MTEHDKIHLMRLWSAAIESYNRKPPSDSALLMVCLQLDDYSLAEIKRAIKLHGTDRSNDGFPPTTNDIARIISGDGKSAGLFAFSRMLDAMGRVGSGRSVCFDDPAINYVIEQMGGWIELCRMDEVELKTYKIHEFDKRYRACMYSVPPDYPRKLIGLEEAYNAIHWPNRVNELRLIGDPVRAQLVHEQPLDAPRYSSHLYIAGGDDRPAQPALEYTRAPQPMLDIRALLQPALDAERQERQDAEGQIMAIESQLDGGRSDG